MSIKTCPRIDLEHKGIKFYFVAENITGGMETKIDNKNYPFFVYDEAYMNCLRNDSLSILEIFDWMETDEYKLILDCFSWVEMMGLSRNLNDFFSYMKGYYKHNPEIYESDIEFLKKLQSNKYVHAKDKEMILEYLENPRNMIIPKRPERASVSGHIYLIESLGLYKIGKTRKLTERMKNFKTIFPAKITEIHSFMTNDIAEAESFLHKTFEHLRSTGEWFELSQEDVNYILSIGDFEI